MRRLVTALLLLGLVTAACGDDDAATPTTHADDPTTTTAVAPTSTAAPTTTTTAATTTTADDPGTTAATETTVAPTDPEAVRFETSDGLSLEGRVYPGSNAWVILGHMFPADMADWFPLAEELQRHDLTVLAYNNRGYGASDPGELDIALDARAALAFARDQGAEIVVYAGASMNGAAALDLAAAEDLAAIVTLSGVPAFAGTDGLGAADDVDEPGLFVAAEDDPTAVTAARAFAETTPGEDTIVIYESGGHGTTLLRTRPEVFEEIVGFVRSHV
ncbi:MAG: alpha/beta hydrolase [Acidimicrobiia bacterium]|nr:alpha/beta hydrolase [Acidimicrobiia bacterium]